MKINEKFSMEKIPIGYLRFCRIFCIVYAKALLAEIFDEEGVTKRIISSNRKIPC